MGRSPSSSLEELAGQLLALGVALREALERDPDVAGPTFTQLKVLGMVAAARTPPRIADLVRFLGTTQPAATQVVNRLERLGLVERVPTGDRRSAGVAATARGRRALARFEKDWRARVRTIERSLSPAGRRGLVELLDAAEELAGAGCLHCRALLDGECVKPDECAYLRGDERASARSTRR